MRLQVQDADAFRAENICLASDEITIDRSLVGIRTGPTLRTANRIRGCEIELALLDDHRLAVRARQPRRPARRYVVDLRFVDEVPVMRRQFAWPWWLASAAGVAAAVFAPTLASSLHWPSGVVPVWGLSIGSALLAVAVGAVALHGTHEIVQFRSVDGDACLVELTGRFGWSRKAATFHAEIVERIAAARSGVSQSRQQYLRDELREHRRLFEDGVLSQAVYEASKRRILQAHD
jgi:hypothetical protein